MTTSIEDVLTMAEAAELTGRTPQAYQVAALRGRLAARKISFVWITTRDDLARYVAEVAEARLCGPYRKRELTRPSRRTRR